MGTHTISAFDIAASRITDGKWCVSPFSPAPLRHQHRRSRDLPLFDVAMQLCRLLKRIARADLDLDRPAAHQIE